MKNRRKNWPGVNQLSAPLVDQLVADASDLEILVSRSVNGSQIVDAGLKSQGSVEAGCRIAEICMADLGHVTIAPSDITDMNYTYRSCRNRTTGVELSGQSIRRLESEIRCRKKVSSFGFGACSCTGCQGTTI